MNAVDLKLNNSLNRLYASDAGYVIGSLEDCLGLNNGFPTIKGIGCVCVALSEFSVVTLKKCHLALREFMIENFLRSSIKLSPYVSLVVHKLCKLYYIALLVRTTFYPPIYSSDMDYLGCMNNYYKVIRLVAFNQDVSIAAATSSDAKNYHSYLVALIKAIASELPHVLFNSYRNTVVAPNITVNDLKDKAGYYSLISNESINVSFQHAKTGNNTSHMRLNIIPTSKEQDCKRWGIAKFTINNQHCECTTEWEIKSNIARLLTGTTVLANESNVDLTISCPVVISLLLGGKEYTSLAIIRVENNEIEMSGATEIDLINPINYPITTNEYFRVKYTIYNDSSDDSSVSDGKRKRSHDSHEEEPSLKRMKLNN